MLLYLIYYNRYWSLRMVNRLTRLNPLKTDKTIALFKLLTLAENDKAEGRTFTREQLLADLAR